MILGLVSILADRDRRRTASVTSLAMVSMALGVWALHEYGKPLGTARNVSGPSVLSSYAAWGRDQYTDVALIIASVLIAASVIWISRQGCAANGPATVRDSQRRWACKHGPGGIGGRALSC